MSGLVRAFAAVLGRDLALALRRLGDSLSVVVFFVLAIVLFPLGVGPDLAVLRTIAAGTIWVAALLAAMLSLDRLFGADAEDGSLDLLLVSGTPAWVVVLAKVTAHWLTTGVPLMVAAPVLAVLMNLPAGAFPALVAAMALGTPTLSLVGAVGAALTVGARRGGVLVPLLVLPLVIPVLIFGVAATVADAGTAAGAAMGGGALAILAGLLLAALALAPWAAAAALRLAAE